MPDTWWIALCDVVMSTRAIEDGRYRSVNIAGAALITAVKNALPGADLPFVFGGDGATLLVPPEHRDTVEAVLAETVMWVREALGLDLRAALIPVAAVREAENVHLLRQSGADSVVVSSETAGRLLGIATTTPSVVEMMEDLLSPNEGFSVSERAVREFEVGSNPRHLADIVLAVLRNNELHRVDTADASALKPGDRLLYIKHDLEQPVEVQDEDEED